LIQNAILEISSFIIAFICYLFYFHAKHFSLNTKHLSFLIIIAVCILSQQCSRKPIYRANMKESLCGAAKGNTCDWMGDMLRSHPAADIALVNICLPGAHDAGMYLTQHCTAFANTGNTRTQYLPMKQQLEAGIRIYDLRPWLYDGEFYAHHSTHCDGLGCKGDKVSNMLLAVREFLDIHHELVLLVISHYCHTSPSDSAFLSLLNTTLGDHIYKQPTNTNMPLIQTPLRQLLGGDNHTGKVILLMDGAEKNAAAKAHGYFNSDELHTAGGWSDDNMLPLLTAHQVQRFTAYKGNGNTMYEWAWQITQHDGQAVRSALAPHARVAIYKGAHKANLVLPSILDSLIHTGTIHKGKIPNILWSDMVDTAVVRQCMKLTRVSIDN
jgi:hypothetical protein